VPEATARPLDRTIDVRSPKQGSVIKQQTSNIKHRIHSPILAIALPYVVIKPCSCRAPSELRNYAQDYFSSFEYFLFPPDFHLLLNFQIILLVGLSVVILRTNQCKTPQKYSSYNPHSAQRIDALVRRARCMSVIFRVFGNVLGAGSRQGDTTRKKFKKEIRSKSKKSWKSFRTGRT
jgi:ABC-type uncharacterized transport system permease subunit